MSRRMIAARAIASISICCACFCILSGARADERRVPADTVRAASSAPPDAVRTAGPEPAKVELIPALGRRWGERELRDLLAAFRINKRPVTERGDATTFLQNYALGVELTFTYADPYEVMLPRVRPDKLMLSNIRLYGPGNRSHAEFKGDLPFGLRFGDSKEKLIATFGPPEVEVAFIPLMRWDTQRYALFVQLDKAGNLNQLSLQLPVVASNRPGFGQR
jgi:hypothetical protein